MMRRCCLVVLVVCLAVSIQAQTPNYPYTFSSVYVSPNVPDEEITVPIGLEGYLEMQSLGYCYSDASPWVIGSVWVEGCPWLMDLYVRAGTSDPVGYYDGTELVYAQSVAAVGDVILYDFFGAPFSIVYEMWEKADCYDDAAIESIPPAEPCF